MLWESKMEFLFPEKVAQEKGEITLWFYLSLYLQHLLYQEFLHVLERIAGFYESH